MGALTGQSIVQFRRMPSRLWFLYSQHRKRTRQATLRASLLLLLRMSYGLVDSVGDVMQMNLTFALNQYRYMLVGWFQP